MNLYVFEKLKNNFKKRNKSEAEFQNWKLKIAHSDKTIDSVKREKKTTTTIG